MVDSAHPTPEEMEVSILGKSHPKYKKRSMEAGRPAEPYKTRAMQPEKQPEEIKAPVQHQASAQPKVDKKP